MKKTLTLTVELHFTEDITGQEGTIIDQIGLKIQHLIEDVGLTADDCEAQTQSIQVGEVDSTVKPFIHCFAVLA